MTSAAHGSPRGKDDDITVLVAVVRGGGGSAAKAVIAPVRARLLTVQYGTRRSLLCVDADLCASDASLAAVLRRRADLLQMLVSGASVFASDSALLVWLCTARGDDDGQCAPRRECLLDCSMRLSVLCALLDSYTHAPPLLLLEPDTRAPITPCREPCSAGGSESDCSTEKPSVRHARYRPSTRDKHDYEPRLRRSARRAPPL